MNNYIFQEFHQLFANYQLIYEGKKRNCLYFSFVINLKTILKLL